jgi:RNA polymerase sigma-70 factor (ECF subfamily)
MPTTTPFSEVVVEVLTVQKVLELLPARHREALLLWAGGLSYAEVAGLMDVPTTTVRVWVHRARAALKPLLAG